MANMYDRGGSSSAPPPIEEAPYAVPPPSPPPWGGVALDQQTASQYARGDPYSTQQSGAMQGVPYEQPTMASQAWYGGSDMAPPLPPPAPTDADRWRAAPPPRAMGDAAAMSYQYQPNGKNP